MSIRCRCGMPQGATIANIYKNPPALSHLLPFAPLSPSPISVRPIALSAKSTTASSLPLFPPRTGPSSRCSRGTGQVRPQPHKAAVASGRCSLPLSAGDEADHGELGRSDTATSAATARGSAQTYEGSSHLQSSLGRENATVPKLTFAMERAG